MDIHTTLKIGEFHTNNCEDFLINELIGSNERLIAVMDGCTMGEESVFASMLLGKILRKISKRLFYQEFLSQSNISINDKLKNILSELIIDLKDIKNRLGLETNELLSTLIIGVIYNQNKAEIITIGDGLVVCDTKEYEYEQNDKPDYLGYHLTEDFEEWYNSLDQKLSISSFNDLSISTDGIFSFKNLKNKQKQKSQSEIINFLLKERKKYNRENFLDVKVRKLKDEWDHIVTDDLAIIRIIRYGLATKKWTFS